MHELASIINGLAVIISVDVVAVSSVIVTKLGGIGSVTIVMSIPITVHHRGQGRAAIIAAASRIARIWTMIGHAHRILGMVHAHRGIGIISAATTTHAVAPVTVDRGTRRIGVLEN